MKKSYMSLLLSFFLTTILLISCASPSEKVENAKEDVVDANNKLDTAIKNYQADINAYKIETASKIAANELAIKNFNSKIEYEKKELRASYLSKIEVLEKKNRDLKNKLDNYQDDGNDKWRTFKAEFGKEMDDLGKSIKDLASKDNE
jgi:lipopolysaccharide export LptBFGC system permease protein LptF